MQTLDAAARGRIVIGSKIKPNSCGDPDAAVDGTLQRLGVDCIDL